MDYFCNNCDAIFSVLISGILGAIGQALRIGIGLFQLNLNKHPLVNVADEIHPSRQLGGIFVGFAVSILLTLATNTIFQAYTLPRIITLIAVGYSLTYGVEIGATYFAKKQKLRRHQSHQKPDKQGLFSTPLRQSQFVS